MVKNGNVIMVIHKTEIMVINEKATHNGIES